MLSTLPIECPQYLLDKSAAFDAIPTAIVNAGSITVLESVRDAVELDLIVPVLVGDKEAISKLSKEIGFDLSGIRVVSATGEQDAAEKSASLARGNEVSSLMKGNIHTDELLRAVISKESGLRGNTWLSHVFHMTVPGSDKVLCITDAAINVLPNLKVKFDIARNAVSLMHAIGNKDPKIALLSATETPNPAMPSSLEAQELVKMIEQEKDFGATVAGPFAFDNAMSPKAAKIKKIDNPVAGNADVLLVPNIETGNALFKQMVYFMSAAAAGVVLGAKVPIILTSRADPVPSRIASTALASIYANHRA